MVFGLGEKGPSPAPSVENGAEARYIGDGVGLEFDDDLHVPCPPHTTERKLVARIDRHVLPFLCVLYTLAFLDRVNISNANVFGLSKDLGLDGHGNKFNVALVIFFVPYIIFEIPSNILLKKFSPRVWLSMNMFMFGFATIMQGIVKNYSSLLAVRFFLGFFETGMFPGCFYLIGMWYRRHEAQKRYTLFFSSTTLAGAFGGLLAAAIGKMNGVAGFQGWRWIFILEGAFTVAVSFLFFFILPSFPEEAKWLNEEEKQYVSARLQADQGKSAAERSITLKDALNVLKDYKVIAAGFAYIGLVVPAYSYAYFAPSILQTYHFGQIETQLHSVPPWAAAFGFSMIVAVFSDWTRHRFSYAIGCVCVAIAGFGILIAVHDDLKLQYGALFLVTMGTYTAMPIVVCWFNMNLGGHHRRAVGSAWQVGFGNIGGIIAVFSFLKKDSPKFITGYSVCIAFAVLSMLSCSIYGLGCWVENRRRDKATVDVGLTEYEKTEMGDLSPEYRYLL